MRESTRRRVVVTMPPARVAQVLTGEARERLRALADVVLVEGDTATIAEQLDGLVAEADIVLSGWGSPPLTEAHLDRAPRLRLIAHTAGSIKRLVPAVAFGRGIVVSHAAGVIAEAVAEMTVLLMLAGLRDVRRLDAALRAGRPWPALPAGYAPRLLAGRALGLVGSGSVARALLRLLQPFHLTVRVADPYLTAAQAAALAVERTALDDVFRRSDIVSIHAPITPETRHLIGARQLALLPDGAILINTARAWVIDQAALLRELQTRRIWAGLDVFEPEPLPRDSPFRQLDNVVLTPHEAGHTQDSYVRQGWAMVEEIERFLAGRPLHWTIPAAQYAIMA